MNLTYNENKIGLNYVDKKNERFILYMIRHIHNRTKEIRFFEYRRKQVLIQELNI